MSRPRLHTMEEAARWAKATFDRKWEEKPDLRDRLKGKNRVIMVDLTDAHPWTFYIEDGRFTHYVKEGHHSPDAKLRATTADLLALFNRDLPVMQAYMSGRVKVDAKLSDVFFVKNLIGELMAKKA